MSEVIIIGAGISGLSCAWALKKLGIEAEVVEATSRAGGVIHSERMGGYLIESGPNSFQGSSTLFDLIDELDLSDELLAADPNAPRFVYLNGRLRKFPFGPLTAGGMLRVLAEPLIRSKSPKDESVGEFFRRRCGRQVHDNLVAPMLTGIYAADSDRLSMAAVFPRMIEMEKQHGSLAGAMLRSFTRRRPPAAASSSKPRPRGTVFSFDNGMETLPSRLASRLSIKYGNGDVRPGEARATVLALPAYRAAETVRALSPQLAGMLENIKYSPMVIAATAVPEYSFKEPLRGFGFLVPRKQGVHLLGTLFSSALFTGRAPEGKILLTSFLGGAFEPEAVEWPDDRVWDTVCTELKQILGISDRPVPVALQRHRHAIPQYNIGHERWVERVGHELKNCPGLFISANYIQGVSVPACSEHGARTAQAVAEYLRSNP
jgi:protoporphyrinogen/coproporphyrinogen III oxidase